MSVHRPVVVVGRRVVGVWAAAVVVATGLVVPGLPVLAGVVPVGVDDDVSVPGRGVAARSEQPSAVEDATAVRSVDSAPVVWPGAGSAVVGVPVASGRSLASEVLPVPGVSGVSVLADRSAGAALRPGSGGLWDGSGPGPVDVDGPPPSVMGGLQAGGLSEVRVVGFSHRVAERLGGAQVFALERADGGLDAAAVDIVVDYSSYAAAFGGGYADRLGLFRLPACAVTSPEDPGCSGVPRPVVAVNNPAKQTLTARVPVSGDLSTSRGLLSAMGEPDGGLSAGEVLVVGAGVQGTSSGDFSASDLDPAGTWQVGLSSGSFTYSFPVLEPPLVAGSGLGLSLNYDSQSIDAFNQTTNNQAGWTGLGWNLSPGFIERKFRSCADDTAGSGKDPDQQFWGDLCWESPDENDGEGDTTDYTTSELYLSLNGVSTRIVKDYNSGQWKTEKDHGWRVELFTDGPQGEYWIISTPDGSRYRFGYPDEANLRVGVISDDPGEPDYANYPTAYYKTWRWNLDRVMDRNENTTTLVWEEESNHYQRWRTGAIKNYARGSYLKRVEYGYNHTITGSVPTGKVEFTSMGRCVEATVETDPVANPYPSGTCPALTSSNASSYPDVPIDLMCDSSSCGNFAPTFFSTKRLDAVTTYSWDAAASSWDEVYRLQLRFKTLNPPGLTGDVLWLDRIYPVGLAGGSGMTRLPGVNFDVQYLSGRVDYDEVEYGVSEQVLPRVYRVKNGYGGRIDVTYGHVAPCPYGGSGSGNQAYWDWYATKVGNWDVNSDECASVWHKPQLAPAGWGQFHKYLALQVVASDLVGGSPDVVTEYEYVGDAVWALGYGFIDSTGATESWNEWRGYPTVRVHTGTGTDPADYSMVETTFFRGLYYDYYDDWSTQRHTELTDFDGNMPHDYPGRAGKPLQTFGYQMLSYDPDPALRTFEAVSSSRFEYRWVNTGDGPGWRNPRMAQQDYQRGRVKLDDGTWRASSRRVNEFDAFGLPTRVTDYNLVGTSADDVCTTIGYAQRTTDGHYNLNFPEAEHTYDGTCGTGPLLSKTETLFDGASTVGVQNPYDANPTEVRTYTTDEVTFVTGQASFDNYGRVTSTTDALNQTTTIGYTPSANWPSDGVITTNPAGHQSTVWLGRWHGQPYQVLDANGKQTNIGYDQLGRPVQVYLPGDPETAGIPSLTFAYDITFNGTTGQPTAATRVTTNTLASKTSGGQYLTSYAFDDGLGRLRETQTASPAGGQIVTAVYYNPRGMAEAETAPFHNAATPGVGLVNPAVGTVPSWTHTDYDTLSRPTVTAAMAQGVELWSTTVDYHGDHTTTTPPAGAAQVTVWADVNGNTTLRQEHLPGGATVDTSYTHDPLERLTQVVDDAGNTWTYTYDLASRQTQTVDPDTGLTTLTYDQAGRLVSTTDAENITVTNVYDQLGRQTARWHGPAGTGTLLAEWDYDTQALGRLDSATRWHNGNPYITTVDGYTDRYQPTGTTVTIPPAEGALAGSYAYTYTYTDVGWAETVTLPAAGGMPAETLTTTYDALGQVDRLTSDFGTGTTYVDATTYDSTGDLIQQLLGDTGLKVARDLDWDETTGRLDTITTVAGADTGTPTTVQDDTYGYDPAGNLLSIGDQTTGQAQCFTYDTLRRLVEAWTTTSTPCSTAPISGNVDGPDAYWHTWTHDTIGNRLTQTQHPTAAGGDTVTTTYTHPAGGQPQPHTLTQTSTTDPSGTVVTGYSYDQTGNTTSRPGNNGQQTLTWTVEGRLDTVADSSGTTSYVYDPDGGRLLTHHADGSAILYLPEGVEVHASSGGVLSCTRYYNGIALRDNTGLTWLAADHHNTTTHAINAATLDTVTRRSGPYGNPRGPATGGTWPDDKTFLGAVQDPTGLIHLQAREYDPVIGRFITLDPIMNLTDPQQIHGYTYSNNNPVTWDDPSGLCATCWLPDGLAIPSSDGSGLDPRCYGHACGNPGRPGLPTPSPNRIIQSGVEEHGTTRTGVGDGVLDDSLTLECVEPARQCTLSPKADETVELMLNELTSLMLELPSDILNACSGGNCGTLGPAQIAWCYFYIAYCRDAVAAAVRSQGEAQDLFREGVLDGGQQNAFRHAYWIAIMVAEYDIPIDLALSLGVAHEMDGVGANSWGGDESKVDLHNNFVGARVGEIMVRRRTSGKVSLERVPVDLRMYLVAFANAPGPSQCPSCLYVGNP